MSTTRTYRGELIIVTAYILKRIPALMSEGEPADGPVITALEELADELIARIQDLGPAGAVVAA